jgi:hypothetical protein
MQAMIEYNTELAKAGVFVTAEGLHPSSRGARVIFTKQDKKVIDGPFAEAKELVAGFWILECKSLEECIEYVKRAPLLDDPTFSDGDARVEVRQLFGEEDFSPELAADLAERRAALGIENDANARIVQ